MKAAEHGASVTGTVHVGQCSKAEEHQQDGQYTSKLVGDAAQDGVDPEEVELGHDVGRGAVGVGGDVVVRVPQHLRTEPHQTSNHRSQSQACGEVLGVEVGVEVHEVGVGRDAQGVRGPVLMEGC